MKKLIISILAILCLSTNAANNDTVISTYDEKVIALTDIWSLDQGIRSDINLYNKLPKEFLHKIDSITFDKTIDYIRRFGFDNKLGKYYNDKYKHLNSAIYAVLLHNPHRLFEPEIYALLKNEVREKRMNPLTLASFLDKYYAAYQRRSLYNSSFAPWAINGAPTLDDKALSDSLMRDIYLEPLPDSVFVEGKEKDIAHITGIVYSASDSLPVANAKITAVGESISTTTNDKGEFTISVIRGTLLIFKHDNYKASLKGTKKESNITIYLYINTPVIK